DRHPRPREPHRAAGRTDRTGAAARVSRAGGPCARAQADAAPAGARRHAVGGADTEAHAVTRVYLSLGSNLGDRLALLRAAVQRLRESADVDVVAASPLYESEPWEAEPG